MKYNGPNDTKLPLYVKNRDTETRKNWVDLSNKAYDRLGDSKALIVANTWLKNNMGSSKSFIKRSSIKFNVVHGKTFIKRSSSGEEYITLELANESPNDDGNVFSPADLKRWEKQINANPVVGDIDHKLYDELMSSSSVTDEDIVEILKEKRGIAKTVKAIYEKGKLWVRAVIDKRYKKLLEKVQGVSVETFFEDNNNTKEWNFLGFTFNVDTTPAVYGAGIKS